MKNMKKLLAVVFAALMVLAMNIVSFAADTTITAPTGTHRYEIYQILRGDLSTNADGNQVLSNAVWGKNAKGKTEGTTVTEAEMAIIAAISGTDAAKAETLADYVNFSDPVATITNGAKATVPTGYYLIKDIGPTADGEGTSLYVVNVVGPTTISPKVGTTSSDKKVDDKNDSNTTEDGTTWQDSADYDIGDAVPFKLSATIAADYANYTKGYKLTFHDYESTGLTFNDDAKVYVNGTLLTSGYTVVKPGTDENCTFEVKFENLKNIASVAAGSVISVEYTSTLNDNAVIGSTGNPNTSHITYSNNPNDEQAGENGKTPDDTVIVFTYKVVANKVEPDGASTKPLKGAGFTLYKKDADGNYSAIGDEVKGTDMTTFEWKGVDDGDYKLVETTVPTGYNKIDDIQFTVTAEHDISADAPTLTKLEGGDLFTGNVSTGQLSADIVNKKGSTLPETGGIGTTIFYVVGSVLMIGAAVLLITKKRMNAR